MFVGEVIESDNLGAPRMTSSGRVIATTWKYGKNTYYRTVKGNDGRIERGQIVGGRTQPIDYI